MASSGKTLILYASAGHGHQKAAQAVAEAYAEADPRQAVECLDVLENMPPFLGQSYKGVYIFLIKYFPWLWGILYGVADMRPFYFLIAPVRDLLNRFSVRRLIRRLSDENPSAIVSTHFLSTQVVGSLKKRGKISSLLVTVITDYQPHFFWLDDRVDAYAVGAPETRDELVRRGVPAERIHVTGIPTGKAFRVSIPREAAAKILGLDTTRFTVLLTSGGAGVGDIARIARRLAALPEQPQVLVVCGTNKKLFSGLQGIQAEYKNLKVFGFIKNMHELMAASDILIGKGGGLTIAESLCLGKPLIFYRPVPGQETRNAGVLCRHGAAVEAPSIDAVVEQAAKLMTERSEMQRMAERAKALGKPDAALRVVRLAEGA